MSDHFDPLPTLVMKFGGTSVGNAQALEHVYQIIERERNQWPGLIIVLSAMAGVTDLLLESARKAVQGEVDFVHQAAQRLKDQHFSAAEAMILDLAQRTQIKRELDYLIGEFTQLCEAIAILGEATPRALDAVAGLGERLSVRLLAAILEARGVPAVFVEATQLIVTDNQFQSAHPDLEATRQRCQSLLRPLLKQGKVPVVTGFIAATAEGIPTTLGRGGSDYTAALLGAILEAEDVWIWSDVDGVMTADPRLVAEARTIPSLTYREIAELAYFGAKVVHPKTIRPVVEAGIGLRVCNTFNPNHPGTRVFPDRNSENRVGNAEGGTIKAVTAIRGQSLITVEGRGMLGVPGVAARTFGAVAATGTSVPLITQASSEQSICFAVPLEAVKRVVASLEDVFRPELARRDIDRIWATGEVSLITVVGAGMRDTPGIAGRVFSALGKQGVNVIAIAQGSSEVSISLVVEASDTEKSVKAIHDLIVDRLGRP